MLKKILASFGIVAIVFFSSVSLIFADNSIELPSTGANVSAGGTNWTSPSNVVANDDSYVTLSATFDEDPITVNSNRLRASGFGYSIPSDATVNGIKVEISRKSNSTSTGSVKDNQVYLVDADGTSVSVSNKADTSTSWPTTEGVATYGGSSDLWGSTWDPADINDTDFGVYLKAVVVGTSATETASVDSITVTVYYTPVGSSSAGTVDVPTVIGGFTSAITGLFVDHLPTVLTFSAGVLVLFFVLALIRRGTHGGH